MVLDNTKLSCMAAIARIQTNDARQSIINEGAPADMLFNITVGAVKFYKLPPDRRCQITGFLFQGDFQLLR